MDKWHGRIALVTGAAGGIGTAICHELVKHGMKVVGADKQFGEIKRFSDELNTESENFTPIYCDLTKDEDIYSLFKTIEEKFGGVDVCVNNAGFSHNTTLLEGTPEEWRRMMDVNVIALCLCAKLAIGSMKERGVDDGHVINLCSLAGHRITPNSKANFYSATKFSVKAITEGLRQELREMKSHIRVSSLSPGFVKTGFCYAMTQDLETADKVYSAIHCLQPEDIASTVIHIMSQPTHVEINDVIIRPTEQRG